MPEPETATTLATASTWTILATGFVAIASGVVGYFLQDWNRRRHESRNIASAFAGEISALMELIKTRRFVEEIREFVSQLKDAVAKGQAAVPTTQLYTIPITKKYFSVFENNVKRIGVLQQPLPEQIVAFYMHAFSIVDQLGSMMEVRKTISLANTERALQAYTGLLNMFEQTTALADQLLKDLKEDYSLSAQQTNTGAD